MQRSRTTPQGLAAMVLGGALVASFTSGISSASGDTTVPGTDVGGYGAGGHRTSTNGTGRHRAGGTEAPPAPMGRRGRRRGRQCGNATSDVVDGDLEGFAGTTPFGEITPEFIARLCEIDPASPT